MNSEFATNFGYGRPRNRLLHRARCQPRLEFVSPAPLLRLQSQLSERSADSLYVGIVIHSVNWVKGAAPMTSRSNKARLTLS